MKPREDPQSNKNNKKSNSKEPQKCKSPANQKLLQEKMRILSKNSKLVSRGMAEMVRSFKK
jgi:hypothetical protein